MPLRPRRRTIAIAVVSPLLAWLLVATPSRAQGVPGADPNACLAGKNKCVAKKIAGLLKCREQCQKSPAKCGQAQADCEAKVVAKFDGGGDPAKSCFAKLEAKEDPGKPASVCTTTGDTAAMEAEVDTAVTALVARLEGSPAPACGDGSVNVAGEQCDGADLDGYTCGRFGGVGALACDGSCDFDASACVSCASFGGAAIGGFCWFASAAGTSCDTRCTGLGLAYDDAGTRGYAGSDGADGQCAAVATAVGLTDVTGTSGDCTALGGLGCAELSFFTTATVRCSAPPTTGAASSVSARRACACK
jgi:hypothetical protein